MIAGFATVAAAETVYKWVDTVGQIHYTDRPPADRSARILSVYERDIIADEGQPGAAAEPAEPDQGFAEEEPAGDEPDAATAAAARSVQADVDRMREAQCKEAQERYNTYIQSQRLFRQLPNGEREYLSDAELTQARIEAKKAVDDFCR